MDTKKDGVVVEVAPEGGVVVGDDGSPASVEAVQFAVEEAGHRRCTLHVLRAWTILTAPRPADWRGSYVPSLVELEAATLEAARARVNRLTGKPDASDVVVHTVHGPAAQALIAASATAHVVVVGSRGRGGFAGLVLGSVAEQCVRHCQCPVMVVRPKRAKR